MINLPKGIVRTNTKNTINYSNRGLSFEELINISNEYYRTKNIALIYKRPTPIKVIKTNSNKYKTIITEAYFEKPSTTDYNGIYKGKYIDFEAKQTKSKTSFNLYNIHYHQIDHLINVINHGGISFILINFISLDITYLLSASYLSSFTKKSIPISFFKEYGIEVKSKYNIPINYLECLDL